MSRRLSKAVWNALAVFFAAWCLVAVWLLLGGDESPVVRLAFAVCAAIGVYAGSVSGLFRTLRRVLNWIDRKSLCGWCAGLTAALVTYALLSPTFQLAQSKSYTSRVASYVKEEGYQLRTYSERHDGTLPPDMKRWRDAQNLLVWSVALNGLRTSDIATPENVVVAYTRENIGNDIHPYGQAVLYLDGRVKYAITRQALLDELRERPALLAHAQRAKAKRDAALFLKKGLSSP